MARLTIHIGSDPLLELSAGETVWEKVYTLEGFRTVMIEVEDSDGNLSATSTFSDQAWPQEDHDV